MVLPPVSFDPKAAWCRDFFASQSAGAEIGVALFVACCFAIRRTSVAAALLVPGDMSVQGNIKAARSLNEPLRVAINNGGKRALIPAENKRHFLEVPSDAVEHVDPIFYGDRQTAAQKVPG
jgi:ATP-dependent Lon protease